MRISREETTRLIDDYREGMKALREDPEAWAEELQEREELGIALPKGLTPGVPAEADEEEPE